MSVVVDSTAECQAQRLGAVALFAVGGAISAVLALAVWVLGYVEAQPWGYGPGASTIPQAGPNPYGVLVTFWACAAAAELLAAAICLQRPRTAAAVVCLAIAVGFWASLAATSAPNNFLSASNTSLAWLVPAVTLVIGIITVLRSFSSGTRA
jgi:hypothetical protein